MAVEEFVFVPPDRRQMWRDLALTISQASALTGVSERQIQHWMDRGYILPSDHGARKVGGAGLDTIVLIRQAREAGIPLRQAVTMARAHLEREAADSLDSEMGRWAARDLRERLEAAREGIEAMQRLLESVKPPKSCATDRPLPGFVRNHV